MILYLHGFNSSGDSAKGRFLKQNLENVSVCTPTYHYDPRRAIPYLETLIEDNLSTADSVMLVGASLGGYYAQYLAHRFKLKAVLINPALMPMSTLHDYLGVNTNFYTGDKYTLTQMHLDALLQLDIPDPCDKPVPTLLLLDKGDELLDYRIAVTRYQHCAEILTFDGGDHQFQHMAASLPRIMAFYYSGTGKVRDLST